MDGVSRGIVWVSSSLEDQCGGKHVQAKPLKGFGGAGVLEIVEDFDGSTFRAVYTVRFADAVYVLHAFQKRSKGGIKTPSREMDVVRVRLRAAQESRQREARRKGDIDT